MERAWTLASADGPCERLSRRSAPMSIVVRSPASPFGFPRPSSSHGTAGTPPCSRIGHRGEIPRSKASLTASVESARHDGGHCNPSACRAGPQAGRSPSGPSSLNTAAPPEQPRCRQLPPVTMPASPAVGQFRRPMPRLNGPVGVCRGARSTERGYREFATVPLSRMPIIGYSEKCSGYSRSSFASIALGRDAR